MARYEFRGPGLKIRITEPAQEGGFGVRIEHESGAALIVPSIEGERSQEGLRATITGFDGTRFVIIVEPERAAVRVTSTARTPILGDHTEARALRTPEHDGEPALTRVTGDETTMPISVDD